MTHRMMYSGKRVPMSCEDCRVNFENKFACDDCPIGKEGFEGDTWEIDALLKEKHGSNK